MTTDPPLAEATMFPLELVIEGTPTSVNSANTKRKGLWQERVRSSALSRREVTYESAFLDERPLSVSIFYFPADAKTGDIDNLIKHIVDALKGVAFLDDDAVERVSIQKFVPGVAHVFETETEQLANALDMSPPVVYIRVDDDLAWRRIA